MAAFFYAYKLYFSDVYLLYVITYKNALKRINDCYNIQNKLYCVQ